MFLDMACGQDATSLFETHHVNVAVAEKMLSTLRQTGTYSQRYHPDFARYNTMRDTVSRLFTAAKRVHRKRACRNAALLLPVVIFVNVLSMYSSTFPFTVPCMALTCLVSLLCGIINTIAGGIGHDALHRLDVATLYLDWSGLSTYEWLFEHVSSHHMYTNTKFDHDFVSMEPFIYWKPLQKGFMSSSTKYILYSLAEIVVAINGIFVHRMRWIPLFKKQTFPMWLRLAPFLFIIRYILYICMGGIIIGTMVFVFTCAVASCMFAYMAHLNHYTTEMSINGTKQNEIPVDFIQHQVGTTKDIINPGLPDQCLLGLDRQVLHHLFPTLPHSLLDDTFRDVIYFHVNTRRHQNSLRRLHREVDTLIDS